MYEGCLNTVPLIHNQPINVTYPVAISALQPSILNRLPRRKRSELTIQWVRISTSLSVKLKMSLGGNAQTLYTHTDIVPRNNRRQSPSKYPSTNPRKVKGNVKVGPRSMLSCRWFPGVARFSRFQWY